MKYLVLIACLTFLVLLLLRITPHMLMLILRVKPNKANLLRKFSDKFLNRFNKNVKFYISPLMGNEYGVFQLSPDTIVLIGSPEIYELLVEDDLLEIMSSFAGERFQSSPFRVLERIWVSVFGFLFLVISVPALFTRNRLLIIEKFFAAPVYIFSQIIYKFIVSKIFLNNVKCRSYRKISMLDQLNCQTLGPHLFLFYNMLYFDLMRKSSAEK